MIAGMMAMTMAGMAGMMAEMAGMMAGMPVSTVTLAQPCKSIACASAMHPGVNLVSEGWG